MDNKDLREFICHMEHFLAYVEDAITSPDLTDFDVLKVKIVKIRDLIERVEPVIGIKRKESNEDRKNRTPSKASGGKKESRGDGTKASRGK